jgi:hypothetical protein
MTIYQFLAFYSGLVKSVGVDQAKKRIHELGYNKTLTMMLPLLFDEQGNAIQLRSNNEVHISA